MPCAGVIIKAKIDKEKISRYTIDWQSINTKVNNLRKLIYRASANGTIILARNLQNLMLKSNVNKLLAINQEKICNYTSIFEIIEYKTFKYLFTAFSVVSILIFSYVSEASGYAEIQRNTHSLELELMPSKLDELIGEIRELNNQTESITKSSESLREAIDKKSMDELELFLETLEKLSYLYDTEDQDLNADTESCMALHHK